MTTNKELAFYNYAHGTNYARYIFTQDNYKHAENGLKLSDRVILKENDNYNELHAMLFDKLQELGSNADEELKAFSICEIRFLVIKGEEKAEYFEIDCITRNEELLNIANRLSNQHLKQIPQKALNISVNGNITLTKAHIMRINSLMSKYEYIEDIDLLDLDYIALKSDFLLDYQVSTNKIIIKGYNPQLLVDFCTNKSRFDTLQEAMEYLDITRANYSQIKKGIRFLTDNLCNGTNILPW